MSGTVKRVAVRLAIEGADQARTQITAVGEAGQQAMGRIQQGAQSATGGVGQFRGIVGQAGFQLQDFVVQVQSGTSALTALSQQGSQFLGAFGPAGAIAGAALTVGLLATQLFNVGDAARTSAQTTEDAFRRMRERAEEFKSTLRDVNELLASAEQNSARQFNERVTRLRESTQQTARQGAAELEGVAIELQRARSELARAERAQFAESGRTDPAADPSVRRAQERVLVLERQEREIANRTREANEAFRRLENAGRVGPEEFGPTAPPAAETARRGGGGGGRARGPSGPTDDQILARFRGAVGQVDPQARILEQYRQQQETFTAAIDAGVISEQEFSQAVEQSSLRLGEQLAALDRSNAGTQALSNSTKDLQRAADGVAKALTAAFEDLVFEGESFNDVLDNLERSLLRIGNQFFLQPLFQNALGAVFGGLGGGGTDPSGNATSGAGSAIGTAIQGIISLFAANGAAISAGRVVPFARGGVVSNPTLFPMANGAGLMGEAGPEGILPLKRNSRGQLGVMAQGGGGVVVNINGVTDAGSFRQSQGQIAASISRAVARGSRNR